MRGFMRIGLSLVAVFGVEFLQLPQPIRAGTTGADDEAWSEFNGRVGAAKELQDYLRKRLDELQVAKGQSGIATQRGWDFDGLVDGFQSTRDNWVNGYQKDNEEKLKGLKPGKLLPDSIMHGRESFSEWLTPWLQERVTNFLTDSNRSGLSEKNKLQDLGRVKAFNEVELWLGERFPKLGPMQTLFTSQGIGHTGPNYGEVASGLKPSLRSVKIDHSSTTADASDGNTVWWTDLFNRRHEVVLYKGESVKVVFPVPKGGTWRWNDDDSERTGFDRGIDWVEVTFSESDGNLRLEPITGWYAEELAGGRLQELLKEAGKVAESVEKIVESGARTVKEVEGIGNAAGLSKPHEMIKPAAK